MSISWRTHQSKNSIFSFVLQENLRWALFNSIFSLIIRSLCHKQECFFPIDLFIASIWAIQFPYWNLSDQWLHNQRKKNRTVERCSLLVGWIVNEAQCLDDFIDDADCAYFLISLCQIVLNVVFDDETVTSINERKTTAILRITKATFRCALLSPPITMLFSTH